MSDKIHPSSLGEWAGCPKKAYGALSGRGGDARPSIASWIGSSVHAHIACAAPPPVPGGYSFFDSITPNLNVAHHQVVAIGRKVSAHLDDNGYAVEASELAVESAIVSGTLDLLLKQDVDPFLTICDVKTGQRVPPGVWLQLGSYARAYNERHGPTVERLKVLHAPRTPLSREQPLTIYTRPARGCGDAADNLVRQVSTWLDESTCDTVPATPGDACRTCHIEDCAVRAGDPV